MKKQNADDNDAIMALAQFNSTFMINIGDTVSQTSLYIQRAVVESVLKDEQTYLVRPHRSAGMGVDGKVIKERGAAFVQRKGEAWTFAIGKKDIPNVVDFEIQIEKRFTVRVDTAKLQMLMDAAKLSANAYPILKPMNYTKEAAGGVMEGVNLSAISIEN